MTLTKLLRESVKASRNGTKPTYSIPVDLPSGFRLDKEGELILPQQPGVCADLLHQVREARLKLQRQVETFERAEGKLREYFIETLSKDSTGLAGKIARVQIETKAVAQVDGPEGWDRLYVYIKRTGAFELLQRRLNEKAAQERIDAGEAAKAGLTVFMAKKVSVTRL